MRDIPAYHSVAKRVPKQPKRQTTATKRVLRAVENGDVDAVKHYLTPKQRLFCEEYMVDFNAAAAVIRAGYDTRWPEKQGYYLRQNPGVDYYIRHLKDEKTAAITEIDQDFIIQEVMRIVSKNEAKDNDKLRGLEMLARHLGMFVERREISGPGGDAIKVQEINREAEGFLEKVRRLALKNGEGEAGN